MGWCLGLLTRPKRGVGWTTTIEHDVVKHAAATRQRCLYFYKLTPYRLTRILRVVYYKGSLRSRCTGTLQKYRNRHKTSYCSLAYAPEVQNLGRQFRARPTSLLGISHEPVKPRVLWQVRASQRQRLKLEDCDFCFLFHGSLRWSQDLRAGAQGTPVLCQVYQPRPEEVLPLA